MTDINPKVLNHLIKYQESFKNKPFLIDMFARSKKVTIDEYDLIKNPDNGQLTIKVLDKRYFNFCEGRLFTLNTHPSDTYYTITDKQDIDTYVIELTDMPISTKFESLTYFDQTFTLKSNMIKNYNDTKPIETTVGKFFVNSYLLASVFGDLFPYDNDKFIYEKYADKICEYAIFDKITVSQLYSFIDMVTFMESIVSIFMPSFTKELLTIDPSVKKLINDLLREHRHELHDPQVMVKIEDAIIKADKDSLKGNSAMDYASNSTFAVHRKRMFHGFGVVEAFGDPGSTINFLMTNLDDGWKKEEVPLLFNDVRRGVYSRGIETANGGVSAKRISQTFQSSIIEFDDCGSTKGKVVFLTNDNYETYLFRYIIDPRDKKKTIFLDRDTIVKYINTAVEIRSPKYCKSSKTSYCYTCFGYKYKKLNVKLLGGEAVKIGSTIMLLSMKAMHGTKAEIVSIKMNDFVS